jgi:hypothetical protein
MINNSVLINFVPIINHGSIFFPATATMPITYHETEERFLNAVAYVQASPDADISKTALDFDGPPQRLQYRLKTGKSKITQGGHNKKLSYKRNLLSVIF